MSENTEALDLPYRAVVSTAEGFSVAVRGSGFAICPGIRTAEQMKAQNDEWGVTADQASRLKSHVMEWLSAALADPGAEEDKEPETAGDEPAEEKTLLGKINTTLLFAATFFSATLGVGLCSVAHPREDCTGIMTWSKGKHNLATLKWYGDDISAQVYEDHLSEKIVYKLLGYCSYHDIEAEAF